MRKHVNLPGQLSFNFDCSYLKWIDSRSEQFESFQEVTQKLLGCQEHEKVSSPIWQEIVCALNR